MPPPNPPKHGNANNVTLFPQSWRDIRLPRWASEHDDFMAIPVPDESLLSDHILPGDLAIVHLTEAVKPGDTVAVFTGKGDVIVRLTDSPPNGVIRGKVIRIERDI